MKNSHINTIDPVAWSDGVDNSIINAPNQADSGRLSRIEYFVFVLAHVANVRQRAVDIKFINKFQSCYCL